MCQLQNWRPHSIQQDVPYVHQQTPEAGPHLWQPEVPVLYHPRFFITQDARTWESEMMDALEQFTAPLPPRLNECEGTSGQWATPLRPREMSPGHRIPQEKARNNKAG